jgi:uncharacterized phage-associated protein
VLIVQKFKLDSRKAIEAAAILAGQSPGRRISRKRLLALMYIANRECLKQSARPLVGGRLAAMQHGPVHADLYDLIKQREGAEGLAEWSRHFHNENYFVVLDEDPGVNALSRFEARTLAETVRKYEKDDDFDVAHQTHRFTEYGITYKKGKARTISLDKIIHAVSPSPMANSILRDLREKQEIDGLFASAKEATHKNDG